MISALAEAGKRHSGALRGRRRLPAPAGTDTGGDRAGRRARLGDDVEYDLTFLKAEGGTRRRSTRPSGRRSSRSSRRRSPAPCRAADLSGLHRQPLAPRRVRHRRVRLLPVPHDARRGRRDAIHSADERVPVDDLELGVDWLGSPRAPSRMTVELESLAELEPALAADGFFARDDVVAHVYIGYGAPTRSAARAFRRRRSRVRCRRRVRDRAAPDASRAGRLLDRPVAVRRGAKRNTRMPSTPFVRQSPRATSTRSTSCST